MVCTFKVSLPAANKHGGGEEEDDDEEEEEDVDLE